MANTIGLTDLNKTVSSALDIDYPITPADVGAASFGGTDEVNVYYNRDDQVISASLNGGVIYNDIYTGVDLDLKPAEFSDTPSETSIDSSTFTNESSYNFTLPDLEHRYTFLNGDSTDDGTGTTANGVDTAPIIYSGGTAIADDSSASILVTTSFTPKTIKAHIRRTASGGFNKYVIGTSGLFGSVLVDSSNNLKVVIDNIGTLSTNITYVESSSKSHAIVVVDTGSDLNLYYDGLLVYTTPTYTPTASTGFRIFRLFDDTGTSASVIEISSVSVDGTLAYSTANVIRDYKDLLKSGKGLQTYTDNNGSSRIATVKTSTGNFQTTQDAVDGLLEGNETVVVYDGISPSATGLPVNAQIIDLAVSPEPDSYQWKTWPYGFEASVGVTGSGSLATTDSKFTDTLTSITGLGVVSAATIVPVAGSSYVKASIVGGGSTLGSVYKESPQDIIISGEGQLSLSPSKLVEVLNAAVTGSGLLTAIPEKTMVVTSVMTATGSISATISYTRYHKAFIVGTGSTTGVVYKELPVSVSESGEGLSLATTGKVVELLDASISGISTTELTSEKSVSSTLSIISSGVSNVESVHSCYREVTIEGLGGSSASITVTKMPEVLLEGVSSSLVPIVPEKFISSSTVGTGSLTTHMSEAVSQSIFFNGYYDTSITYTFKI